MIHAILFNKVLSFVTKQLLKQFKLDKILDYVEKPNDLDKQMKVVQKNNTKYGKCIEEIEKDIAVLKKDSHPPIFTEEQVKEIYKYIDEKTGETKI